MRRTVLLVAAGLLLLPACGGGGGSDVEAADLAGRTFTATRADGDQVVVVSFLDVETVDVDLGCDRLDGVAYSVDDEGRLVLPEPFTSGADCSDAQQLRDQAVLTVLVSVPEVSLEGGTLQLATEDGGELTLTEGDPPT